MRVITNPAELRESRWYLVGVENLDGDIFWSGAPILQYHGGGAWSDGSQPVETVWDAGLQMEIDVNSADGYVEQV